MYDFVCKCVVAEWRTKNELYSNANTFLLNRTCRKIIKETWPHWQSWWQETYVLSIALQTTKHSAHLVRRNPILKTWSDICRINTHEHMKSAYLKVVLQHFISLSHLYLFACMCMHTLNNFMFCIIPILFFYFFQLTVYKKSWYTLPPNAISGCLVTKYHNWIND